jgi:hypothetical protein
LFGSTRRIGTLVNPNITIKLSEYKRTGRKKTLKENHDLSKPLREKKRHEDENNQTTQTHTQRKQALKEIINSPETY